MARNDKCLNISEHYFVKEIKAQSFNVKIIKFVSKYFKILLKIVFFYIKTVLN